MVFQEKATQTKQFKSQHRKYCGLISKNMLQFASSLLVPLMLGIFTVVITLEQQKVASQRRLEDKQQRDQDLYISQIEELAQIKAASIRYQSEVLVAYIKEIGNLLEKEDGSLTSDPLTHTLARVKTLNTIRQLDGSRQIHVIRFLWEAGQLSYTKKSHALDISTAELNDIDFRKTGRLLDSRALSLGGVYLVNSTFSNMDLRDVDFSFATLNIANFSSAQLDNVDFSFATLDNVTFSSAQLKNVDFSSAKGLYDIKFSFARLSVVNFSSARFGNIY
jgi:uncharacterized protein YjbI with pentapeptide repeats